MEFKEAAPYVIGAYMGIWAVLIGYVLVINNKLSGLKKELDVLSKAFEKKANK